MLRPWAAQIKGEKGKCGNDENIVIFCQPSQPGVSSILRVIQKRRTALSN